MGDVDPDTHVPNLDVGGVAGGFGSGTPVWAAFWRQIGQSATA
jgi:hypothetical protein